MYNGNLSLHDADLLADVASEVDPKPPADWLLLQSSTQRFELNDGYRCHVFMNAFRGMIVFSHGTDLEEKEHFEASMDLSSGGVFRALDEPPASYRMALEFTQSILLSMEEGNQHHHLANFSVYHVGRDLGGAYAHMCGYAHAHMCHYEKEVPVVTFDSPGMRAVLEQHFGALSQQQVNQHHMFTCEQYFSNEDNQHIGRLYGFRPDEKLEEPISFISGSVPSLHVQSFRLIAQVERHDEYLFPEFEPCESFISKFDPRQRVTESKWVISLINSGKKFFGGHSVIFVEGIEDGHGYVGSFDITARELEVELTRGSMGFKRKFLVIWNVRVQEEEDHRQFDKRRKEQGKEPYWLCTGASFVRSPEQAQAMIQAIKQDKAQTDAVRSAYIAAQHDERKAEHAAQFIPYQELSTRHKEGRLSQIFSLEEGSHNCTSYCIEKLELADVEVRSWNKPEKAAGGTCCIA